MCTVIYDITLRPEYTTQGNDIGMLQPHGINTTDIANNWPNGTWADWPNVQIGADYTNYPNPSNVAEEAYAESIFSVKALVDPNGTPIGFKMDVVHMYYSVCVRVHGVENRWIELMVGGENMGVLEAGLLLLLLLLLLFFILLMSNI